ncbi:SAF domain-containing protein [Egicoccus halophilus]|uniref:SAF domain-containing protein n=1 Tax=Egicoccus halophilus TaxID=1670830 RepID=A0A8J3ADU1_9ACTN|nr:SAF domain-containing protein [Egicoccus halophilus]GGI05605.1 hypothetical protein GCM10011354_14920 [Egicoccus halophilus]
MVDLASAPTATTSGGRRRVRRQRGLPGGRAVIGALLVAAAAVGVFGAHLRATAEPATRYLVASRDVDAGTRVDASNLELLFGALPLELAPAVADRSVLVEQRESLLGQVVTAPIARGDLLSRSDVADDGGVGDGYAMSFPVAAADAVAGDLRRGQLVDVLATYGSGEGAYTTYVVVGVPLVAVGGGGDTGFGAADQRTLTVALAEPGQVQALAHAVSVADVVVIRSPQDGVRDAVPAPFRPGGDVAVPAGPGAADARGDAGPDAGSRVPSDDGEVE